MHRGGAAPKRRARGQESRRRRGRELESRRRRVATRIVRGDGGDRRYPISLLLDKWVPEEARAKTGEEMVALVEVERELAAEAGRPQPFLEDEEDLVRGAMALRSTAVRDVWIEADRVRTVPRDSKLDDKTLEKLRDLGHSRAPLPRGTRPSRCLSRGTWLFRGDGSRRRRGRDVDTP